MSAAAAAASDDEDADEKEERAPPRGGDAGQSSVVAVCKRGCISRVEVARLPRGAEFGPTSNVRALAWCCGDMGRDRLGDWSGVGSDEIVEELVPTMRRASTESRTRSHVSRSRRVTRPWESMRKLGSISARTRVVAPPASAGAVEVWTRTMVLSEGWRLSLRLRWDGLLVRAAFAELRFRRSVCASAVGLVDPDAARSTMCVPGESRRRVK